MNTKIQTAKFVANPGSVETVFAADIDLKGNPKYQQAGRLIILAKGSEEDQPVNPTISAFAKKFFENKGHPKDILLKLTKDCPLPLLSAYILDDQIVIVSIKSSFQVFLKRSGKLALLLGSGNQEFIEGVLKDADIFLFATNEFVAAIDPKSLPLNESFKVIDSHITSSNAKSNDLAALVVKVSSDFSPKLAPEPIVIH